MYMLFNVSWEIDTNIINLKQYFYRKIQKSSVLYAQ